MAVEVASLKAVLDLDKKGLDSGLKESKNQLGSFRSAVGLAADTMGAIGLAVGVFAGVTSAIQGMTQAARESIAAEKQLNAVIASTGGAAGVTAEAAKRLASELQNVTNFEDDAIIAGESMLLTFTKIGSDVFPRATETMLDMSQALGQDLKSSAIQLGKALNDPIKGITALSRVGVTFSAQQKQMIKDFMATGDIAKAQGVILDELAKEFGGSARALADPWIQLNNAMGDINEALGMALLPALNQLAQAILPAVREAAVVLGPVFAELGAALAAEMGPAVAEAGKVFIELIKSMGVLANGVKQVAVAMGFASEETSGLTVLLAPLFALAAISRGIFSAMAGVFNFVGHALEAVAFIVAQVKAGWNNLNSIGERFNQIGVMLSATWTRFTTALSSLWSWINKVKAAWDSLVSSMGGDVGVDKNFLPGSPTPFEMGLRGINQQMKAMQSLSGSAFGGLGGMTPSGAGVGGGTSNITINIGGVSATSQTMGDPADEAVRMTLELLRAQLKR